MHQAASQWSELADVEIIESSVKNPMIQVSAGRSTHYPCNVRFDSQTLAHAFFPPHGQIHVNDNVHFTMTNFTERYGGNSLYSVVAHEMGHALGFSHSPDSESIMFAYDTPRKWKFTPMDKYRMQMYYGTKKNQKKPKEEEENVDRRRTNEREKVTEQDDIRPNECRVGNPIVVQYRGEYLIFKSQWVWRVSSDWKSLISKAVSIDQLFPGLPNPIDAAVAVGRHLWVFVGEKIYVIYGNRIAHAPLTLKEIGINERYVDLAYEWHYFNPPAVYIWKGSRYWKLDEKMDYRKVDERYPKAIDLNWARVPKGVHSAFTYQKEIHFVRDDEVFRMNSSRSVFDVADGFPQPFQSFFGFCPRNEKLVSKNSSQISFFFLSIAILTFFI
uniref:ZnMc domain-containing protein n=1 Tax=Caenorhabditis tropicalis TaxID=1561998 RepID=A0A1I7T8M7_9PELO